MWQKRQWLSQYGDCSNPNKLPLAGKQMRASYLLFIMVFKWHYGCNMLLLDARQKLLIILHGIVITSLGYIWLQFMNCVCSHLFLACCSMSLSLQFPLQCITYIGVVFPTIIIIILGIVVRHWNETSYIYVDVSSFTFSFSAHLFSAICSNDACFTLQ